MPHGSRVSASLRLNLNKERQSFARVGWPGKGMKKMPNIGPLALRALCRFEASYAV
jgi:hypothetical protein